MTSFFSKLLDTSDFPARWHCGIWTPGHGWLHVLSDLAVSGAYFAIPVLLVIYMRSKKDLTFPNVFWLFVAFIAACGTVHLVEASIFWWPAYRLSGVVKGITAIVSLATVFALVKVMPEALKLPGLASVNQLLEKEISERRESESQLKQYSKELQRSNEELDEFAYVASHDLKAPLRAISALSGWIEEDEENKLSAQSANYFRKLRSRTTRMETLLEDLLLYSRVGREDERSESVDVGAMIRGLADDLSPGMPLETVIEDGMPSVVSPRLPLEHVFRNLISNAIKHHDKDRCRLTFGFRDVGQYVEFTVADDGPGIDPKFHDKVFQLFETLKPRDQVEGSGMGLAVIKKIIGQRECEINVESDGLGHGTVVRFTWPKHISSNEAASPAHP